MVDLYGVQNGLCGLPFRVLHLLDFAKYLPNTSYAYVYGEMTVIQVGMCVELQECGAVRETFMKVACQLSPGDWQISLR